MSWQDVTRSSLFSDVKECGTKRAINFLSLKSSFRIWRTTVFGMLKNSAIIFYAIRRSFLNKSAIAAMFTSVRVNFGRPPVSSSTTSSLPPRNREYQLKSLIGSKPHSHKPLAPNLAFLSHFHHPPSTILKKADFTRQVITRTLSKINKWNSVCERMLVDSS